MTLETIETGALASCAACAVQLGADPMIAPIVAGLVAVAVRQAVPALLAAIAAARRGNVSTQAPPPGGDPRP